MQVVSITNSTLITPIDAKLKPLLNPKQPTKTENTPLIRVPHNIRRKAAQSNAAQKAEHVRRRRGIVKCDFVIEYDDS
jgi:hypothetical protein